MMTILSIDIETKSSKDLSKCGVYAYCEDKDFEILLFAYAFDNEEVEIIDFTKNEKLPKKVLEALLDDKIIKSAFNANFERICISAYLNLYLSPKSWRCSQVHALSLGLPLSLDSVGEVLSLKNKKLKSGKNLIKFFNKGNSPKDYPDKWQEFKNYCIMDVKCEREIREKLSKFPISHDEELLYELDQEINDRGIGVDMDFVKQAIICDENHKNIIKEKLYKLTKLDNVNSISQMKKFLHERNVKTEKLDKKSVEKLMNTCSDDICEILNLRKLLSKTSVRKYESISKSVTKDERVHGLFQFYGASRTGRWSGRLVQVQNLPQNRMENLEYARNLLKNKEHDKLNDLKESTPEVLSQLIRTAFVPKENHEFIVVDFSAIEARVLSWISNEKWRLEVFKTHGKIYEASASEMFNIPMEDITKDLRQKGKIAELALGYGGSVNALISMGALEMNLQEDELLPLVQRWRNVNINIKNFWYNVGHAALETVSKQKPMRVGKITFEYYDNYLFIKLPSGRKLSYFNPMLKRNIYGKESLTYEGIATNKKWQRIETYGPKLVENIVQGISRDILAYAMMNLKRRNFKIVMHVHDEVVLEVKKNQVTVEEICEIITIPPPYAEDLCLKAEAYKCDFYKKE